MAVRVKNFLGVQSVKYHTLQRMPYPIPDLMVQGDPLLRVKRDQELFVRADIKIAQEGSSNCTARLGSCFMPVGVRCAEKRCAIHPKGLHPLLRSFICFCILLLFLQLKRLYRQTLYMFHVTWAYFQPTELLQSRLRCRLGQRESCTELGQRLDDFFPGYTIGSPVGYDG